MNRKSFIMTLGSLPFVSHVSLNEFAQSLKEEKNSELLPVLYSSHGNPFDIPLGLKANPFLTSLYQTGEYLRSKYEIKAVMVISAHWCTKGTFVQISKSPQTLYDYYGFPPEYYTQTYPAPGSPEFAQLVASSVEGITPTDEWGLDHGAWPMLKHMFPDANYPVFQLSLDYYQSAQYHYQLAQQLKFLRRKGVLIIGSGSLIHNLREAMQKFGTNDMKPFGWEYDFDGWLKQSLDSLKINDLIAYQKHPLGLRAAPTPDHYVPMLYTLGLMEKTDNLKHTFEEILPAFSNRSFMLESY